MLFKERMTPAGYGTPMGLPTMYNGESRDRGAVSLIQQSAQIRAMADAQEPPPSTAGPPRGMTTGTRSPPDVLRRTPSAESRTAWQ